MNEAERAALSLMAHAKRHGGLKRYAFGHQFDSEAEYRRFLELRNLQIAGEIRGLIVHPEYELVPPTIDARGVQIPRLGYCADFEYREGDDLVIEEVKAPPRFAWHTTRTGRVSRQKVYDGARGPDYIMRVNLLRRRYPNAVFREVRMGR